MTTQTLPSTRDLALEAVSTVTSALREVIDGDEAMATGLLSDLTPAHIAAVVPFLTRTLGLLVGVESAKKAAKR